MFVFGFDLNVVVCFSFDVVIVLLCWFIMIYFGREEGEIGREYVVCIM